MSHTVAGRIVKILDETKFVANVGLKDGVTAGDRFVIFEPGEEIVDPETRESLGQLELVKVHVEAAHVQERMTLLIPQPILKDEETSGTVLSAVMAKTTSGRERLHPTMPGVRRDQMAGIPVIRPIQIGDRVRKIEGKRAAEQLSASI